MKVIRKSTVVFLLLWVVSLPIGAQSLRDYIRSRVGNTDTLMLKALSPSLCVIRQQYQLERDGHVYGANEQQPYYGETYSLGIKISGESFMQRAVVFPWEKDADYQRVNKSGKYKPVMFRSLQHALTDSIWQPVDLELGTQYVMPFDKDSLIYSHTDAMSDFGLSVDENLGEKRGYLVWAYTDSHVQDSTMHVSLRQNSFQTIATLDSMYVAVNPADEGQIIGGIFVVPQIERAGVIKLLLAGVAAKDKDGNWKLVMLTKNEATPVKADEPVKQKKEKRKKQNKAETEETPNEAEPVLIK